MAYLHSARRGLGSLGSSTSQTDAAQKLDAFARVAKEEAERAFKATWLGRDADRALADEVVAAAQKAVSDAKNVVSGRPLFLRDPSRAKAGVDTAAAKAASLLPQIKDIGNVAPVQTAASTAKSAIDAAVAADRAAARSNRNAPLLPAEGSTGGGFSLPSIPPIAIGMLAVAAALFLLPSGKRSNPSNIVKTREDEKLWRRAKAAAKKQGRSGDYRYVVGTFKRMQTNKAKSRLAGA